jgi:hypothetical protein
MVIFWAFLLVIAFGGFGLWAMGTMMCISISRETDNLGIKAVIFLGYLIATIFISVIGALFVKWVEKKCMEYGKIGQQV